MEHANELYKDWLGAFAAIGRDTAARILAVTYVHGNNEALVYNDKYLQDIHHIEKMYQVEGGESPDADLVMLIKQYVSELEQYRDEHAPKWAYIIRLLGTTGCRVSELIQFTYEQIQAGSCDLKGKGSKYRRFFFTKQVQDGAKGKSGYVCMNRYGSQISTRGIAQELKNLGTKCGIAKEKMHPHAFRHFFAKMYLKKTKDVVSLADILGHGSVDITRIYLQKSYDEQKKEVNRVVNW